MTLLLRYFIYICILLVAALTKSSQAEERENDICAYYAILTKIDEFHLTQQINQTIGIDLSNMISEMESVESASNAFKMIAEQSYSSEEKLKETEPELLIPFTPDYNLIKVTGPNPNFANLCKMKGGKVLEFEPETKSKLTSILTNLAIGSTPFKAYPDKSYLVSGKGSVLDAPASPEAKLIHLKSAYAQIRGDGQIEYPGENTLASIATTPVTGLCLKPNNYWDLQSSSRNKWLKAVKIIVNSIRSIPTWKESAMQLISKIPVEARTQAQAAVQKVVLQAPPQLKNMISFFNKYQYKENWENSSPSDGSDFFTYIDNFKAMAKFFKKILNLHPKKGLLTLPAKDLNIKEHMAVRGLSTQSSNSMTVRPLHMVRQEGQEEGTPPSLMTAQVLAEGMDEDDLVSIYMVKPLISLVPEHQPTPIIVDVTYIVQTKKQFRALQQQPHPYGCQEANQDHQKTCKGFHMPRATKLHANDALKCGKSIDIISQFN